jgi:hypothetical protein
MDKEKYFETLKEGHGHLNPNTYKRQDGEHRDYDYCGFLKLPGGEIVRIMAWRYKNKRKNKKDYFSVVITSLPENEGEYYE